jgi:hypothetical protein
MEYGFKNRIHLTLKGLQMVYFNFNDLKLHVASFWYECDAKYYLSEFFEGVNEVYIFRSFGKMKSVI